VAEGEADCVVLLRWVKVLEQGDPSLVWDEPGVASTVPTPTATNEQGEEIVDWVFQAQNWAEDIALIRAMGFEVDDDNEPAPENIPPPDMPLFMIGGDLHEGQEWGWDGIDQRAGLGGGGVQSANVYKQLDPPKEEIC
jgi:hypothetical protein